MPSIQELQTKIQDLQTQINATQAQINDYKTNPKYYQTYSGQYNCGHFGCMEMGLSCGDYYTTTYFSKVRELANAESTLKSLQNQLATTQAELDSLLQAKQEQQAKQEKEKEKEKEKQEALKKAELARLLAQCSTPPPSTDLVAIKRVLESLNNLQAKLLSI